MNENWIYFPGMSYLHPETAHKGGWQLLWFAWKNSSVLPRLNDRIEDVPSFPWTLRLVAAWISGGRSTPANKSVGHPQNQDKYSSTCLTENLMISRNQGKTGLTCTNSCIHWFNRGAKQKRNVEILLLQRESICRKSTFAFRSKNNTLNTLATTCL